MGFEPVSPRCMYMYQLGPATKWARKAHIGNGAYFRGFLFPWINMTINFNEISLTSLTCIFDDNKKLHVPLVHFSLIVQIK